jgi:hypothetical protein
MCKLTRIDLDVRDFYAEKQGMVLSKWRDVYFKLGDEESTLWMHKLRPGTQEWIDQWKRPEWEKVQKE